MGRGFLRLAGLALALLILVPVPLPARDAPAAPGNHVPAITAAIADVSRERLYTTINELTNFTTRYAYTPNALSAAQYIFDFFNASEPLEVSYQDFTYGGTLMRNVVAVLPGLDPQNATTYIVGGHYDTMSPTPMTDAPGSDDDGSGTAGTMELARVLSGYRFNSTLIFVTFSAEELGLVGSDFYSDCCAGTGKDVGLYLNLDMIGYDPTNASGIDVVHDAGSVWAADQFLSVVADYGIGIVPTKVFDTTANSDHASFWAAGYDSIFLAESNFNPNWHLTSDLPAAMNIDLVTNTTQAAAAFLATLAGIREPGPGVVTFDRAEYGVAGTAQVRLYDPDLNFDPFAAEPATLVLTSPQEPGGEPVNLLEDGNDTGVFVGTLPLGTLPGIPGELQVAAGATIIATYTDASPPGPRSATALIDGVLPVLRNIAVVPGVDSAWIVWETSEPTDAQVSFGTTTALGTDVTVPTPTDTHRVELRPLSPDTLYYFDVRSTDSAGQAVLDDRGGMHFTFHTMTGVAAVPLPGHVGYARSAPDPGINYFTANRILSGYSTTSGGRIYRGGVQFDFGAQAIPAGGVVTRAWVELHEDGFVYAGPGQWRVEYLNGSIDPGWTGLNYSGLTNAASDFQVPPTLGNADMRPLEWRVMDIPAAEFPNVQYRVNTGLLSFRIDGPTFGGGSLYQWGTGYPAPCAAVLPAYPHFTATYSPTGDFVGPNVTFADGFPNPTMLSSRTTITADVSDAATGGTEISDVEFFLGGDPGVGLATPMTAADGGFDAVTETAVYDLDVSTLPPGGYTVGVRGRDRANNWGSAQTFLLYVGVWDLSLPNVTVSDSPDPAPLGASVTITANVTDDIGVAGVWLNVTDPSGSTAFNVSMPKPGADWVHVSTYAQVGTWLYVVWARDTTGRWNLDWGTFLMLDVTPPVITAVAATPDPGEYVAHINITATITDDSAVWGARINVTMPDGTWLLNYTMLRNGDAFWHPWDYGLPLGTYTFVIWASDIYGLVSSASGSFVVRDSTPPLVVNANAVPDPVEVYEVVNVSADVSDLLLVPGNLTLRIIPPNGSWYEAWIGWDAVSGRYYHLEWYSTVGLYSYVWTAHDTSNNTASASGTFLVRDTTPPLLAAWADRAWVLNPGTVNLSAQALDAYLLDRVAVTITAPDSSVSGPYTMTYDSVSGLYRWTVTTTMLGTYGFNVTATDSSGNANWSAGTFDAIDGVPPEVTDLWARPPLVELGQDTRLGAVVTDDVGVASVHFQVFDAGGTPVGNYSAVYNATSGAWEFDRAYAPGEFTVRAWVADAAGNLAAMVTYFTVGSGGAPNAVAGPDQDVLQGTSVIFDGSQSTDDVGIVRWEWVLSGPAGNLTFTNPTFDYRPTIPGVYTATLTVWDAMGRSGTDEARLTATPVSSGDNKPVDLWPWLLLLLLIALIIAAIVVYLVVRRKKEKEEEPPPSPMIARSSRKELIPPQAPPPPGQIAPPPPPDDLPPPPS